MFRDDFTIISTHQKKDNSKSASLITVSFHSNKTKSLMLTTYDIQNIVEMII